MRRPSRSKIFPRGARIGMLRTRFCCARTSYSSLLRICRLHNPYDNTRNTSSVTYCTAVNLIFGSFSSRSSMTAWNGLCQRDPYLEYNILGYLQLGQRPEGSYGRVYSASSRYNSTRSVVHVGTPAPKKSWSSVQ